ncbi:MAG: AAA family ATPase, partial [Proteobacteria bacterium]|nr:AAA family ATPase [Pseudomonadota bacterium]
LKDKQNLRAIIAAAQQIATNGYQAGNVEQYATASRESLLDAIQGAGGQAELIRLADGLQDVSRSIIAGEQLTGQIMTGYPCLDDRVGGLSSSLLHVVAGRPSMGKSAFCLNVAINAATAGHKVSYFTLEDAIPYQQRRAISRYSTVDLGDIIQGRVTSDLHHRINEAVGSIEALPLWMSDRGQTVDQIRAAAWSQKSVNGLDLLFIDHLGYVADQGKEYEVVSNATRKFAHLAKELEIPVVLVVQLNRGAEEKENSRPRLKDLRGSGRIEEDARSIWFCYRPGYYWPDDPAHDNVFELIIAKTSHGPTGLAQFYCNLAKMFFRDATGY